MLTELWIDKGIMPKNQNSSLFENSSR